MNLTRTPKPKGKGHPLEYGWFDFDPMERKVIALHTAAQGDEPGVDLVKLLQIKLTYHQWRALASDTTPLSIKRAIVNSEYQYREQHGMRLRVRCEMQKAALSWMKYFATPKAQKIIAKANQQDCGTAIEHCDNNSYGFKELG